MRATTWLFVVALLLLGIGCASPRPTRIEEHEEFARYFDEAGVSGTFVVYDPAEGRYLIHDRQRATRRYIPASTFKILNALISLDTGVVADTSTVFEWDGIERGIPQWNRDHSLTTAIRFSVVWYFQELARRVGEQRMRDYVRGAKYGNGNIDGGIDQFWLTGDLRISAMEQVDFLERLHDRRLPFSERAVDAVEGILVEQRGQDYVLRGKTGWADGVPVDLGWYVGYVVKKGRPYYFALNIDIERPDQGTARRAVARAILADRGLF